MKKLILPRSAHNWITSIGAFIAVISGLIVISLLIFSIFIDIHNPYLGIFSFLVMPAFLIFGLLLIPFGMLRYKRRESRGQSTVHPKWPIFDFNKKSNRNAFLIFSVGTFIFLALTTYGSYNAFHFSESVTFCGTTCHKLMEPEYTAYQNSPHARVACVKCHVGEGAGWYTKSKLSGAYQVYATIFNKYPTPIPTPIEDLRPARGTCEQCHWPQKFFGAQQKLFHHYLYDDSNTAWPINLLLKTGGSPTRFGDPSGIHWHVGANNQVEYISRDERRQDIPWVKLTDLKSGKVTIYQDSYEPLTEEEIQQATPRMMDCIDCHNRPSHIYNSPDHEIDQALAHGTIDRSIPEIKRIAVEAMSEEYASTEEAMEKIEETISNFYQENYPDFYGDNKFLLEKAIETTRLAFSENIFPAMKVQWSAYPSNIGHFTDIGCMRCHLGNHETEEGQKITHDCNACHAILAQGSGELAENSTSADGLEFEHPEDIDQAWMEMGCYECHSGVQP